MTSRPASFWTPYAVNRLPYLLTGVTLFCVKFVIDWLVASYGFGRSWSPMNYVIWPNDRVLRVFELSDPERRFSLVMLLVSLPFIWIGVMLTLHRLRAAGLPLGFILFFFVPLVNLLLFFVLVLLPSRRTVTVEETTKPEVPVERPSTGIIAPDLLPETSVETGITRERPLPVYPQFESLRRFHRSIVLESYWRSGLVALAITVPLWVLAIYLGTHVLESYGFSLFVGAPFALGMTSVLLFGFSRPKPLGSCLLVAAGATATVGGAVLAVALEGAICLIMVAPIAFTLAMFGALVGYVIQARPWLNDQAMTITLAMLITLPALMAAEAADEPEPDMRAVVTEVIINAPPERVWQFVIAFPPLPEPDDWLFRAGVAYPQKAVIHGSGVGAIRHCVFSTGTFVEPIEVWDPPKLLRFTVTEQPDPMREWSPFDIHPAHLDHYLRSHKGQFLLEPLPGGRTRLVGTTWYTNRMWPAAYWHLWTDYIIHRIHGRVLNHIAKLTNEGG